MMIAMGRRNVVRNYFERESISSVPRNKPETAFEFKEATLITMRTRNSFIIGGLCVVLTAGCASNRELQRLDALERDANWPKIREAAETEIARRDGNTDWSYSAYYGPRQHTNGVWEVVAAGAYPLNRLGDRIDMLIRDNGEVISYSPHFPDSHPQ